ncbi:glycosyltransferase [Plastoroseomonas hellenica]|uniref:glycosyltransferase n=1 Tax=Plastoroseomonas hellenica TaxID=2687306 RepID=UPI001BADD829|nr:glycosyltransferase [Plastoroseomonas hellenica]MBR0641464.1 glycosyltransferase [Plastoroseomonas hellenica]
MPRVTVVTPTYNRATLIPETIASVLGQTLRDFEYLVIDDGSTDDTAAVARNFGDPRLSYYWHENRGEAATTNRGWAMARGEYFAVLSSDDPVQPRWLERLVAFMDEHSEILVAYPDWQIIDVHSRVLHQWFTPDYDRDRMIASFFPFPGVGAVIRKSALRDLRALRNPDYRYAPDLDCWLRLSLRGPFARVAENLAAWRSHDGSITINDRRLARATEMIRIAEDFLALPDLPQDVKRLAPITLSQAYAAAHWVVQDTHPLRAALFLRRSHALAPVQHEDILPNLKRYPRPDDRTVAHLLRDSVRHRAFPILRAFGRRTPLPLRRLGASALLRAGLLDPNALLPKQRSEEPPAALSETTPVAATSDASTADPVADNERAITPAEERFDAMLPQLREDLTALSDCVSPLTPTKLLLDVLRQRMKLMTATGLGAVTSAILQRMPARVEHVLVLPWISTIGGSETVTARLIEALRRHYRPDELCILAPDEGYRGDGVDRYRGIPFIGFSDVDASLSPLARQEIFDSIMVQRRPKVVHCINSNAAWHAFRERAAAYASDSALFANIYSDIRLDDGAPGAGYYYDFLPHCIESLTAVFADNEAIVRKASTAFGLGPALQRKLHVVRTPVLGIGGHDPERDLRPFQPSRGQRSLWLSRLAKEKRLDVLASVARRCPERSFTIHGTMNGQSVDLDALTALPNVEVAGDFSGLDAIAFDRFDSYVFTTSGEGMPISLLEVAARGLPLVAPQVGGIGELVHDGTGWLISRPDAVGEYIDALSQIQSDPNEARRRVEAVQRLLLRDYTCDAFDRSLRAVPRYFGGLA